MVKSIAGTTRGPVHAPVYKSEAKSRVSETVQAFAWRNIKMGCHRKDCGDETEELDRDKGGKQMRETRGLDSRWLKSVFFFFLVQSIKLPQSNQDSTRCWPPNPDPGASRPLNRSSLVTSPLYSSPLELSGSPTSELAGRASKVMHLLTAFPTGRMEAGCKQGALKQRFRLHVQH